VTGKNFYRRRRNNMKWLWKNQMSWADMLVVLVAQFIHNRVNDNFFLLLGILVVGFLVNSYITQNNYHEPLPRQ
jgi:hypothetical protein